MCHLYNQPTRKSFFVYSNPPSTATSLKIPSFIGQVSICYIQYISHFLVTAIERRGSKTDDQQNQLQMKYANFSMDKQHLFIQGHIQCSLDVQCT